MWSERVPAGTQKPHPRPLPAAGRGGEERERETSVGGGGARRERRGRGHEVLEDLDQALASLAVEVLVLRTAEGPAALPGEHVDDDAVDVVDRDADLDEE